MLKKAKWKTVQVSLGGDGISVDTRDIKDFQVTVNRRRQKTDFEVKWAWAGPNAGAQKRSPFKPRLPVQSRAPVK